MREVICYVSYADRMGRTTHRLKIVAKSYLSAYKAAWEKRPTKSHDVVIFREPLTSAGIDLGTLTLEV